MARNLFSVPIFFIVFRETLEAAIIVSVLLGLVEQLVNNTGKETPASLSVTGNEASDTDSKNGSPQPHSGSGLVEDDTIQRRRLLRRMRIQIFVGAAIGLLIALAIGAAFIAVWFTKASDLWMKSEELWEGIFNLIASLMIFAMGISVLKMDRAKVKWRIKLTKAFNGNHADAETATGKWVLLILPLVTVMREGLEAVVFVGGVSLGQSATSIPIAAIVGLICGLVCGFLIYEFASRTALTVFLVVMTNLLLLIGAGLFSKAVGNFEMHAFNVLLGADVDDSGGTGPGSYRVQGNVWHLDCCNPEAKVSDQGWTIFYAIFGWSNNGSLGTILSYVFYWIAVIGALIYMKYSEGRIKLLGRESAAAQRRNEKRAQRALEHNHENDKVATNNGIRELPK
ncbi:Plasma membrane iron permease [Leucoagaricus sp. SymC.cos]|nr:Plasma membrane iron permease [Leucoagaricus sp. SymC.cos]